MKEFYIMNLDMRRIAIIAGGALTALGLALFVGMAIGRGQGEKNARIAAEDAAEQKIGIASTESADRLVLAAGPDAGMTPPRKANEIQSTDRFAALEKTPTIPSVPEVNSEIPLREDPLVSGPPKKSTRKTQKVAKSVDADEESSRPRRKKNTKVKRAESEVSGRVEHASARLGTSTSKKRRNRSQLSEEADEQLSYVAGTARSASQSGVRYTIQVAAFKRSSEANGLINKLKGEGIKARSEKSGDFYLVTVGRTKSKTKLEKALSRLKELEYDAYIRKLSTPSSET